MSMGKKQTETFSFFFNGYAVKRRRSLQCQGWESLSLPPSPNFLFFWGGGGIKRHLLDGRVHRSCDHDPVDPTVPAPPPPPPPHTHTPTPIMLSVVSLGLIPGCGGSMFNKDNGDVTHPRKQLVIPLDAPLPQRPPPFQGPDPSPPHHPHTHHLSYLWSHPYTPLT